MTIYKVLVPFVVLLAMAGVATPTQAQPSGDTGWQATYWNNPDLAGDPVLTRIEADINYNWGAGSPNPSVTADRFSARWTRLLNLAGGRYRFTVVADDGVRLWVDNRLLIDRWQVQAAQTYSGEISLAGGAAPVRLEYFENIGGAEVRLSWTRLATASRWQGEYFNTIDLAGAPALVRSDTDLNFDWGNGSPAPGIVNSDQFSVRWTRQVNLPAGRYRFTATVDDGVRLWVNDQLIVDRWQVHSVTPYTGEIFVNGGTVPVRMEYFEADGLATARLTWAQVAETAAPLPTTGAVTWRGEYFDNITFNGPPVLVRSDGAINFDWRGGSPAPEIRADRFAIRWTTTLNLPPGRYAFTARADDGIRVWVNGRLIIDQWVVEAIQTTTAETPVTGGAVPVKVEYYENTSLAYVFLNWTGVGATASFAPSNGLLTAQITGVRLLNVRSGPGMNFTPLTVLPNGTQVQLLGRNQATTWIQVRLANGSNGWVARRYLTSTYRFADLPMLP